MQPRLWAIRIGLPLELDGLTASRFIEGIRFTEKPLCNIAIVRGGQAGPAIDTTIV